MQKSYLSVNRDLLNEYELSGSHRNNRTFRTPEAYVRIKNKPTNVMEEELDIRSRPEGMQYFYIDIFSQGMGHTDEKLESMMEKGARPVKKFTHAPELVNLTDDERNMLDELRDPANGFNKDPFRHFIKRMGLLLMEQHEEHYKMYEDKTNENTIKSHEALTEEGFNSQPQPFGMYKEINRGERHPYRMNDRNGRRNGFNQNHSYDERDEIVQSPYRNVSRNF